MIKTYRFHRNDWPNDKYLEAIDTLLNKVGRENILNIHMPSFEYDAAYITCDVPEGFTFNTKPEEKPLPTVQDLMDQSKYF